MGKIWGRLAKSKDVDLNVEHIAETGVRFEDCGLAASTSTTLRNCRIETGGKRYKVECDLKTGTLPFKDVLIDEPRELRVSCGWQRNVMFVIEGDLIEVMKGQAEPAGLFSGLRSDRAVNPVLAPSPT